MHKRSSLYFMRWKLHSNRWSRYGLPLGIIWNFYGRTGKHFSSNIIKSSYVLETICWRHQLFYKKRFYWIMSVLNGSHPSIQFKCEIESNNRLSFPDVFYYIIFVMDKVLRHVFTGNPQTQTFLFIRTPLFQSSGNTVL